MTTLNKGLLIICFIATALSAVLSLSLFSAGFGHPYEWVNYGIKVNAALSVGLLVLLSAYFVKLRK